MNEIPVEVGRVVISKCGRDEGRRFLVMSELGDEFVMISDGKTRPVSKQKKKRRRHLKGTRTLDQNMRERLLRGEIPQDHELAACLSKEEG